LALEDSLLEEGDEGLAELFTPLEAEALAEVQDQLDSHHEATDGEEMPFNPAQAYAFGMMKRFMKSGKKMEEHLTCEDLPQRMRTVVQEAAEAIKPPKCSEQEASEEEASEEEASEKEASSGCDYASWAASLNVDSLVTAQNKIIGLAAVADKKRCLPESMPSPEETSSFLQSVLLVHEHSAASTDAGKNRLQEAYLQLVSFQQGFVSHAEGIADRGRLLSRDIGAHACPQACGLCNRYQSPAFGFHCLLKTESDASDVTQEEGMTCTPAKKRRFNWFARVFRKYNYEMQCTVADWKQAAVQQVQISASMSCASTVLAVGVRSELTSTSRYDMFTACMGHQQSGEMDEATKKQYTEQLKQVDTVVSPTDKAVVGLVLAFGQVSGLAALRAASRAEGYRGETDEAGATWDPSLFIEPFAQHLLAAERDADHEEEERKDLAMYGDKELLDRDAVMARLEKSKAAQLQGTTDVVAVGTMPLVLFAIENRGGAEGDAAAASTAGRGAAVAIVLTFAFVIVVAALALQIWLAHIVTMGVLSLFTAAGAAKTILYILSFLFIGLPVSSIILSGFSRLLCAVSGGKMVTRTKQLTTSTTCKRGS